MITYTVGDIFKSPAKVLVNPVNTKGVMGKGLALQFKKYFPEMFRKYQQICESKDLDIGKLWLYKTENKWVLNFPTKTTWRNPSKVEYIEAGLRNFVSSYIEHGLSSVAFPKLGCGNGELDWTTEVKPLMEKYLSKIPIMVFVYLGEEFPLVNAPEHKDVKNMEGWLRTEPAFLTWEEVLSDLKREILVNNSGQVKLHNGSASFEVDFSTEAMFISDGEKRVQMNYEDLESFWIHVRDAGYFNRQTAPAFTIAIYDQIVSIFIQLPYCQLTKMSDSYEKLKGETSLGFQVVPPSSPSDPSPPVRSVSPVNETRR